jgi:hypothetical protein
MSLALMLRTSRMAIERLARVTVPATLARASIRYKALDGNGSGPHICRA